MSLLLEGLEQLGLIPEQRELDLLDLYISEIELWNPKYGLVNVSDRDELIIKHILDSLTGLPALRRAFSHGIGSLADVGSGAGFPGIPLAIFLPQTQVSLIEKSGRRCRFLENVKAMLGLTNVHIVERAVEEVSGAFDIVTFRAFTPLEPLLTGKMLHLLAPGGKIAAYKGRAEVFALELAAIKDLASSANVVPLTVPYLTDERHLVFLSR